ncbi:M4 family metallopeptidase [Nocardioides flavescens]|uniref:Neutral metalloproteinase n=1 Tax=Nocardioides flavescens TaxID=2691959 RepID=A0A6L7F4P8_9ACTN|nr:M4 family metallopeptidase [Nocardioides flavescens]MXG92176.1 peptidase M4 family protein [Nocardioides flavescens]
MSRTHRQVWSAAAASIVAAGTLSVAAVAGTASATTSTGTAASSTTTAATTRISSDEVDPARAVRVVQGAVTSLRQHGPQVRLSRGQAFRATDAVLDSSGASHVRMQRTYRGLRVVGGDLVVHQSAGGAWAGVSQTLGKPLRLRTTPGVTEAEAIAEALAPSKETREIDGLRARQQAPQLVVDTLGQGTRLAWAVETAGKRTDGTPSRMTSYVDAKTGEVLRREEGIQTVDGSGQSLYSGTVPLQVTQSGTTYQLKDATRGGTYTTDMAGKQDSTGCSLFGIGCSNGTLVTSSTTTFGNGTNANRASAAVDAQYGTNETWDYYNQVHARAGIFGNGKGSFNRVHYGKNYANAFWDGTKMTYGDGDGTNYGPLVSLDVAGHEMSHGVTENTAGLTYSGESGGLNEATSDIFGTMVEFYAANSADPGDYLIGEEFDLKNAKGFRRMDNPVSDGKSPNCWSTGTKDLDVHYSSGVGNHFFYLLAEGSGAKTINGIAHSSTTCNGSTVTGIGRDAAQRIWFRALTVYMTSGTTYAQARTATLDAARDLYGAGSTQQSTVAAAWSAVSVN